MLQDQETVLRKLGLFDPASDALIPIYASWSSPDGVAVNISSALTERKGVVSRCTAFAKRPNHDLWLPEFWDDGYYDHHLRDKSPFAPLVWSPETHSLGIDVGDEIAAKGPGGRPRLGIELTKSLALLNEPDCTEWHTTEGRLALRSQVWGNWKPDPDHNRSRHHEDGEILWASSDWLDTTLFVSARCGTRDQRDRVATVASIRWLGQALLSGQGVGCEKLNGSRSLTSASNARCGNSLSI